MTNYEMHVHEMGEGDKSIYHTVDWMRYYMLKSKNHKIITDLSSAMMTQAQGDHLKFMEIAFDYVVANIKYVLDHENILNYYSREELEDTPENYEFLQNPEKLLDKNNTKVLKNGDCDDLTMALGSLLLSVGIPVGIIIIATDTDEYAHVYLEGMSAEEKMWFRLDPVVKEFGKEYKDPRRIETFEIAPNEVAKKPKSSLSGLGFFNMRNFPMMSDVSNYGYNQQPNYYQPNNPQQLNQIRQEQEILKSMLLQQQYKTPQYPQYPNFGMQGTNNMTSRRSMNGLGNDSEVNNTIWLALQPYLPKLNIASAVLGKHYIGSRRYEEPNDAVKNRVFDENIPAISNMIANLCGGLNNDIKITTYARQLSAVMYEKMKIARDVQVILKAMPQHSGIIDDVAIVSYYKELITDQNGNYTQQYINLCNSISPDTVVETANTLLPVETTDWKTYGIFAVGLTYLAYKILN